MEIIYTNDWWQPLTITDTKIGLEDFLFGFVVGGIASVIYEDIFKKRIKIRKQIKKKEKRKKIKFIFFGLVFATLFFGSYYILQFNTFISSIIAFGSGIIYIYVKKKGTFFKILSTQLLNP